MHPTELERLIIEHDIPPKIAEHIRRAPPSDQEATLYTAVEIYDRIKNLPTLADDQSNVDTRNR